MSAVTGISQLSVVTPETPSQGAAQETEQLPRASEEAVQFLSSLDDDDFKHLLFNDSLVTTSDTGKELGEFSVTMESAKHQGEDCILIHANSHGSIDNVPCGTSIMAYVTRKLITLEQQHHEYVKLENHPLDRKTFIVKQEGNYVVNRVISQGADVQRTSQTFNTDSMQGFISEGSNLLLQRILAKKGISENFQLISFDSDTVLCSVVYKSLEERFQYVNNAELKVTGIERTINSLTDLPTTWQSYFTKDGHLTSRVQVGSPVTMRLSRVPTPVEEDEEPPKPTFEKQQISIDEDMQLYSRFLDRKEELKGDHAVYMRHHPELKALMADFLQFLLLRKPDDVVAFAADYFSSFSTNMPSVTPYLQSSAPTPFPQSRMNTKISGFNTS